MFSQKILTRSIAALAVLTAALLVAAPRCAAEADKLVHSFNNNHIDGTAPYAGLISDTAGNLYGTTKDGGLYNGGTVFNLSPKAGGGWTETVLYSFGNGTDGVFPFGGLILDKAGNLYGSTLQGNYADAGGIVYELSPNTGGTWTETVLHVFGNGTDGVNPNGSLVFDAAGNLYGTTLAGGTGASGCPVCGTVFELSPAAGGSWTEAVLWNFHSFDAYAPMGNLIIDAAGNLYGLTFQGGTTGNGTAFELVQTRPGIWMKKTLHTFGSSPDGEEPVGGLVADTFGNLYGTLSVGGSSTTCGENGCGAVFELSLKSNGNWGERILHNFANNGVDGYTPYAGLVLDASGNLYGTTQSGGASSPNCNAGGCGTVFELTPRNGGWSEKVLHYFTNSGGDGAEPQARLLIGPGGNLYGTALGGGAESGVVFELKP